MSLVDAHTLILKLVDVATAALPSDVQVLDGRDYSVDVEKHAVIIGMSTNPGVGVMTVTRAVDEGSVHDSLYDVAVACRAAAWDGEEEFTSKRAAVQESLATLNAALEADNRLDGTVFEAFMSPEMEWFQVADTEGNSVEVDFTITVQVFA